VSGKKMLLTVSILYLFLFTFVTFSIPSYPIKPSNPGNATEPITIDTISPGLNMGREQIVLTVVPLVFAVIHFIFFVIYPKDRGNLHFSIVAFIFALNNYLNYLPEIPIHLVLLRLSAFSLMIFGLLFVSKLFQPKLPKHFKYIAMSAGGLSIWIIINPDFSTSILYYLIMMLALLEIFRLTIVAISKKLVGAKIMGVFFSLLIVAAVYENIMDIFEFTPILGVKNPGSYASLFPMIGMSLALAQNYAATKKNLIRKTEDLHNLNLELEARVEQRTVELDKANQALAKQNLDLEESRNNIESAHQKLQETFKELQNTQAFLVQSEKMAALGNLVAGVAHEINNPTGAVCSAADNLKRYLEHLSKYYAAEDETGNKSSPENLKTLLDGLKSNNDVILLAGDRIATIVKSLKNFARLDEAEYQEADIQEGLENTLILLQHKLKDRIEVIKEYADLPKINCFPNQLNQVFMNILNNAIQAIENKGTIKVKTMRQKDQMIISISDNGKGISKDDLKKIFDPGFTTKSAGIGTGLGLSICFNIIRNHKGKIEVISERGQGTEFFIKLPMND